MQIKIMLNTGLRSGEALALCYDDFDFEAHTVRIERNAVQVKKRDRHSRAQGGYDLRIQTPKTRASRDTIKCGRGTNGSRGAWRRYVFSVGKHARLCGSPYENKKPPNGDFLFWQGHKGSNSGHAVLETDFFSIV